MFLLNIAADEDIFSESGIHYRLHRNFIESMPNIMLFAAGISSTSLVLIDAFSYEIFLHEGWICIVTCFIYLSHKYTKLLGRRPMSCPDHQNALSNMLKLLTRAAGLSSKVKTWKQAIAHE